MRPSSRDCVCFDKRSVRSETRSHATRRMETRAKFARSDCQIGDMTFSGVDRHHDSVKLSQIVKKRTLIFARSAPTPFGNEDRDACARPIKTWTVGGDWSKLSRVSTSKNSRIVVERPKRRLDAERGPAVFSEAARIRFPSSQLVLMRHRYLPRGIEQCFRSWCVQARSE